MKVLALFLIILGAIACGGPGEEETPVVENQPPVAAPDATTQGDPAIEEDTTLSVIGGSRIGKYIPDDWVLVNTLTQQFYDDDLETLYASFTDEMKTEWPLQKLRAFRSKILTDHGDEVEVIASTKEEKEGYRAYKRAARFSKQESLVEVAWVLDGDDRVAGLFVTPERTDP
jgi:hypothetical protein